jgi:WhiB family transcriptional regulator, redox-sensing transcriptional regulator
MTAVAGVLGLMILLPLALNEFGELAPWMARRLLCLGTRLLGSPDKIDRYAEEWSADLEHVPGKLTKLAYAVGVLAWSVPRLRWQYRRESRKVVARVSGATSQAREWITDWTTRAACKDSDPDELFGQGAAQNRAKLICRGCPVRTECLADALDNGIEFGVWGGMTERERYALLRRRPDVTSWRELLERAPS